jgi:hypothetical protein
MHPLFSISVITSSLLHFVASFYRFTFGFFFFWYFQFLVFALVEWQRKREELMIVSFWGKWKMQT